MQHYLFCPRQCALSYIEQTWQENLLTAEGGIMHERAHGEGKRTRAGARIECGVALISRELGLSGKADVVEYHKDEHGVWIPFPIEYKHGRPKSSECDIVQLCAQALCLEEMLGVSVQAGAIFYGKTRRRFDVVFDEKLRMLTKETAASARAFIRAGVTSKPEYGKKCKSCSLIEACMPKIMGSKRVENYIKSMVEGN